MQLDPLAELAGAYGCLSQQEFIKPSVFGDPRIHAWGGKNGCPAGQTPDGGMGATWPPIQVASRKMKPGSTQPLGALRQG